MHFHDTVSVLNNTVALNINGTPVENTSCVLDNGSLDINVAPAGTYSYLWSNSATTEDLSNLPAGSHTVTVSLGTCLSTSTFAVTDNALPPNLSTSGLAASCDFSNGAADLNVSGGVGPFSFLWSNNATTENLSNLPAGNYSVTVTGTNGCTSTSTVSVLNNTVALNISGTPLENTSCLAANGSLDINVAPAGTYSYLWSNSATTQDLSNLAAGIYTVTVNLGTCLSTSTFAVMDNTVTPNVAFNITASICSVNNGAIDLTVSGSTAPYTFLWSNSATSEDLASLLPGNYSVTVTAANGCSFGHPFECPEQRLDVQPGRSRCAPDQLRRGQWRHRPEHHPGRDLHHPVVERRNNGGCHQPGTRHLHGFGDIIGQLHCYSLLLYHR